MRREGSGTFYNPAAPDVIYGHIEPPPNLDQCATSESSES